MRILRGKSNLEVSSHGFALFVVGLILATFVGGAVRTVLRSDRVHQRIVSELKTRFPKLEIKIGGTEVLLSSGIWPGLGLKLSGVQIKKDICGRMGFTLDVPRAVLPVSLWSLRKGEVRLGDSEISGGHLHLQNPSCPETSTPNETGTASAKADTAKTVTLKPPELDWRSWGRSMNGISVRDFTITHGSDATWMVRVLQAHAGFGHEFSARAIFDVQKNLPVGTLNHLIEFEAASDDRLLEWLVTSEFKEGRISWKGSWDVESQAAMSTLDVTQMPIKDVLTELYQLGIMERELDMRSTWLSCSAGWEGSLNEPASKPVRVRSCKVEGAYGGAQLESAEVFPLDADVIKVPLDVRVQSLQLQPLAEALDLKVLPAVINKLGVWTGQVHFLNKHTWGLDGHLDNIEVVFSNKSVRGKQALKRIHTKAEKVSGEIAAKIDAMDIPEGQFIGTVEFSLNETGRDGKFRASIDNLLLSPAIQSLLIGGKWESLKAHGSGSIRDGELAEWRGVFEASVLSGGGWKGDALSIHTRFVPGVFSAEGRLHGLVFKKDWRYFGLLRDRMFPQATEVRWRDLKAKVDIRQNGGEVLSLTAVENETGKSWRARGSWSRDRDFSLLVNGNVGGRSRGFSVRSEKGLLSIDE